MLKVSLGAWGGRKEGVVGRTECIENDLLTTDVGRVCFALLLTSDHFLVGKNDASPDVQRVLQHGWQGEERRSAT